MSDIRIKKTVYVPLKMGEYDAEVLDIETEDGQFGEQLKFAFSLDNEDKTLHGWCSFKYSDKTKLYAWTKAILGSAPDEFSSAALIGKRCVLAVVQKVKDDGATFNRIEAVLPAKVQSVDNVARLEQAAQLAAADVPF